MKKIFKWFFPAAIKPTNEFKKEGEYATKVTACKYLIAMYSDRNRYHSCPNSYWMTTDDWQALFAYDDEQVEMYKQELLLLEAEKLLGNIK